MEHNNNLDFLKKLFEMQINQPSYSNRWGEHIGHYFLQEVILAYSKDKPKLHYLLPAYIAAFTAYIIYIMYHDFANQHNINKLLLAKPA